MTHIELTLCESMFTTGFVTVLPNSMGHKAAFKLCKKFGWIERETMAGDQVVYQYRVDTAGFNPMVFNNGNF